MLPMEVCSCDTTTEMPVFYNLGLSWCVCLLFWGMINASHIPSIWTLTSCIHISLHCCSCQVQSKVVRSNWKSVASCCRSCTFGWIVHCASVSSSCVCLCVLHVDWLLLLLLHPRLFCPSLLPLLWLRMMCSVLDWEGCSPFDWTLAASGACWLATYAHFWWCDALLIGCL